MQIKLAISLNHSIPTPGRKVPALTQKCQAPGRVAPGVSTSYHGCDSTWKRIHGEIENGIEPRSAAVEADALTLGLRDGPEASMSDPTDRDEQTNPSLLLELGTTTISHRLGKNWRNFVISKPLVSGKNK